MPVPKPVSPITRLLCAGRLAKRSARRVWPRNMLGFFDAFVDREIDVVVLPRMGAALVVPVDLGVLEKGGFRHGWFAGDEWQVASGKSQVASRKWLEKADGGMAYVFLRLRLQLTATCHLQLAACSFEFR